MHRAHCSVAVIALACVTISCSDATSVSRGTDSTSVPFAVRITNAPSVVWVGANTTVAAVVEDRRGNTLAVHVRWSSSAPATISVDSVTGSMTSLAEGSANITATAGTLTATVSVQSVVPAGANLSGTRSLFPGAASQFFVRASYTPRGPAAPVPASWSSSDTSVAGVSQDGLVTAHRSGTASITASFAGQSLITDVTVRALNGQLVFLRSTEPDRRVERTRFDGSAPYALPIGVSLDQPSASRDGKHLAFLCGAAICKSDLDGVDVRVLRAEGGATDPSWSADGERLVMVTSNSGIQVLTADGTSVTAVSFGYYAWRPRFAPDDSTLVFGCDIFREYDSYICRRDAAGAVESLAYGDAPTWSPTGDVAFISGRQIVILNPTTRAQHAIVADQISGPTDLAWAPDGAHLAVLSNNGLWIIEPDGSNPVRFDALTTVGSTISYLSWVEWPDA